MFNFSLDNFWLTWNILNMFNTPTATDKGEQTRGAILATALEFFRTRGFDETRMRDIAAAANVALGTTYYYFASKDAILQAYYETVQAEHERRVRAAFEENKLDLVERLKIVMHTKLDIVQHDRKLLGAIFRYAGEPEHPLSCLGPATGDTRRRSFAVINHALAGEDLPEDLARLLAISLWSLQMGMMVYFIYDKSEGQQRTRKLVDSSLELTARVVRIAKSRLLRPLRTKILDLLREAGLLSDVDVEPPLSPATRVEGSL
jgi:AcrR family transcriptional regulator